MQVLEKKPTEYNIPLYVTFVNYEKAFDSSQHRAAFKALRAYGVSEKYINIIKETYSERNSTSKNRKAQWKE